MPCIVLESICGGTLDVHIQPSNLWTTFHMFLGAFVTNAVVQSRRITNKSRGHVGAVIAVFWSILFRFNMWNFFVLAFSCTGNSTTNSNFSYLGYSMRFTPSEKVWNFLVRFYGCRPMSELWRKSSGCEISGHSDVTERFPRLSVASVGKFLVLNSHALM